MFATCVVPYPWLVLFSWLINICIMIYNYFVLQEGSTRCPLCGVTSEDAGHDTETANTSTCSNQPMAGDELVRFLIESTNEKSTQCANCDSVGGFSTYFDVAKYSV